MGKKKQYLGGSHVRKVMVQMYYERINAIYFGNNGISHREYEEKICFDNIKSQRVYVAEIHPHTPIQKASLNIETKFWLTFISSRFWPSQNETLVGLHNEVLLGCIMTRVHLNVGRIIYYHNTNRAWQTTRSLPFPCMITGLCRNENVPIFCGWTEIRYPQVVKPPSVANFWFVVCILGAVNSKVTNFIKTIPDMIKAVVAEANKDLRERVYGLEKMMEKVEVGGFEDLASVKLYLSQLQTEFCTCHT
ncbi:hypothetical protein RND71_009476 [Anisodus tanguticus]|uniref:Putative plant transposon protein domain-containing protein n=1 Tax=Anisodus tanguticus TaxID=243964 RepID=A0AAE1VMY4_9SOLA|nr:hypothetical protein RND71_009476 [Anisodus tanguticus]